LAKRRFSIVDSFILSAFHHQLRRLPVSASRTRVYPASDSSLAATYQSSVKALSGFVGTFRQFVSRLQSRLFAGLVLRSALVSKVSLSKVDAEFRFSVVAPSDPVNPLNRFAFLRQLIRLARVASLCAETFQV
jgi:hypothetical protein